MPYEICANKMTSNLQLVSLLGAQDIYIKWTFIFLHSEQQLIAFLFLLPGGMRESWLELFTK